ncbi:MAG: HEAT repeat domain-containing protein [Phycisphaeraceae bacterium]|nr:HEAT repeat domain-containing protein [Phycisphaeraceae bacterium]
MASLVLLATSSLRAADSSLIDQPMYADPALPKAATTTTFDPRLMDLWTQALAQPDADTRRQAAAAIAEAGTLGMPDAAAKGAPLLAHRLTDEKEHPLVRLAAAQALDRLDAKDHVQAMDSANAGDDLALVLATDPALARWKHAPAVARWRQRAETAATRWAIRLSALESLGQCADAGSAELLSKLVRDARTSAVLRLTAAKSLGLIAVEGLVPQATELAQHDDSRELRLMAVWMLRSHRDDAAIALLANRLTDKESAVVAAAERVLLAAEPAASLPSLMTLSDHPDAEVRRLTVDLALAIGNAESVAVLADRLGDAVPRTRYTARDALIELGQKPATKDAVAKATRTALGHADPLARQEAAMVAGKLNLKESLPALTAMMETGPLFTRTAATAAVRWIDPASGVEPAKRQIESLLKSTDKTRPAGETAVEVDAALAQMFQILGMVKDVRSESLGRVLIPKNAPFGPTGRVAAIWAMGKAWADRANPPSDLATLLVGRLQDAMGMQPESEDVRVMSVVTLARLGDKNNLGLLNKIGGKGGESSELIQAACRWAVSRLTGQPAKPLESYEQKSTGWFLEPMP